MDITVTNQKENPLLSRNEVTAKVIFEKVTPSRKDIQGELAKKVKAKPELFIVKKIDTAYGDTSAIVTAYAYSDEAVMKRIERQNLVEKHAGHDPKEAEEEAKKKAEEAAAAAKEEKDSEHNADEQPTEKTEAE